MARIDIQRRHHRSPQEVRALVDELAASMQAKFGVDSRWDGDVLRFARAGLDGSITVDAQELHLVAELGFLLSAMKGSIQGEIERKLDERLGAA